MADPVSNDSSEPTDISFDPATIDLSLIQFTSSSESSTSDLPTGLDRSTFLGSPAEALDIEAAEVERKSMVWLQYQIRRPWWLAQWQRVKKPSVICQKTFKKYIPKSANAKFGLFFVIFTLALGLYKYIHIKEPTLAYGERATAAAEASAMAVQYATHMNWLINVCTAEVLRNITNQDCIQVIDDTTPIPLMPEYKESNSLQHMLVRRLMPFVNASRALENEMLASNNFCSPWEQTYPGNCSVIDLGRTFDKRSITVQAWSSLPRFPLPSNQHISMLHSLSAKVPLSTIWFFVILLYQSYLVFSFGVAKRWSRAHLTGYFVPRCFLHWRSHLVVGLFWCLCWFINLTLGFGIWTWLLTYNMAKGKFIDICMSYKVIQHHYPLNTAIPTDCLHVFKTSSVLSIESEIRAWSIWRGYFFAMANQYSMDDLQFVSAVLLFVILPPFVFSLFVPWPANFQNNFINRYIQRRRDDGYLLVRQDSESAGRSKKT